MDYDYLLYCDGSSDNLRKNGAGFAALLLNCRTQEIKKFYGGSSYVTTFIAEIMPFLLVLPLIEFGRKVQCVSDNEALIKIMNGEYGYAERFKPLINALHSLAKHITIEWVHTPRNIIEQHIWCDKMAGELRKHFLLSGE